MLMEQSTRIVSNRAAWLLLLTCPTLKVAMHNEPIRVVIVDNHARYRSGLMQMLNEEQNLTVVGEGSSAADAIELAKSLQPHLIVLDLDMPGNGLYAAEVIRKAVASTKIVMLTTSADQGNIEMARENGVDGYIVKGITARALADVLRAIIAGTPHWPVQNVGTSPTRLPRLSST